jgi:hypothetical protein
LKKYNKEKEGFFCFQKSAKRKRKGFSTFEKVQKGKGRLFNFDILTSKLTTSRIVASNE